MHIRKVTLANFWNVLVHVKPEKRSVTRSLRQLRFLSVHKLQQQLIFAMLQTEKIRFGLSTDAGVEIDYFQENNTSVRGRRRPISSCRSYGAPTGPAPCQGEAASPLAVQSAVRSQPAGRGSPVHHRRTDVWNVGVGYVRCVRRPPRRRCCCCCCWSQRRRRRRSSKSHR